MIKVLIADDSPTAREFLAHLLAADPEIEVIGTAANGLEVLHFLRGDRRPDVITMDIDMPVMDGLEATRRIMETDPHPVVIVSGLSFREKTASMSAFEVGAVAAVERPAGFGDSGHQETAQEIISTVKAMAEVKLVRRWPKGARRGRASARRAQGVPRPRDRSIRVVGMGASTGGPAVLKAIIAALPDDFPLPVVIVQHMSATFLQGFAEWLTLVTGKVVRLAVDREELKPGGIYVAPENVQMGITPAGVVELQPDGPSEALRPSVSFLFESLSRSFGPGVVGVLLTGMGRDGADAMKMMKEGGGVTIAQAAETCIVNGMPMEAVKLGAVDYILPPEEIPALLCQLAEQDRPD